MTVISNMSLLNQYSDYLLPRYSNFPRGRYVSLLVIRKTEVRDDFPHRGQRRRSGEGDCDCRREERACEADAPRRD